MMKRKSRLKFGIYLIILAGTISYYEYRLWQFKGIEYITCYQLKSDLKVIRGQELKEDMFQETTMDKKKVNNNYIKSMGSINKKIASENMYGLDILTSSKIKDKDDWDSEDDRYVNIVSENGFSSSDVRPGDHIDVFVFNTSTQSYDIQLEDIEVINIRNKDQVAYADNINEVFTPYSIYFKNDNSKYKDLIDKLSQPNSKLQISIHGNRPNTDKVNKPVNPGILNVK